MNFFMEDKNSLANLGIGGGAPVRKKPVVVFAA